MSHSPNENDALAGHAHKSFKSVAVTGPHGEIAYEGTDAPAKVVIISLGIVAGLAAFCFGLMFGYDKILESEHPRGNLPSPLAAERVVPPAPQLERLPWLDLPEMRANENKVLNSSDMDAAGRQHVPIDQAIDQVVSKINVEPDAPKGLTVPGGQGLVFSHSLADMPANYQRPVIQGVIQGESQKNAK